jgi:hypothetical protein
MRSTVRRLAAGTAIAALSTLAVTGFAGAASAADNASSSGSLSGSTGGSASHDQGAVGGFDYTDTTVYMHTTHIKGWGAQGSSDRRSGHSDFTGSMMRTYAGM